jgi:hypothetical protein
VPDDHNITPVEPFQRSSCCANELGEASPLLSRSPGSRPGRVGARAAWPGFLVHLLPRPSTNHLASPR